VPATESLTTFQMFIDGQWTDAAVRDVFESDDPYQGKPWALIPRGTSDLIRDNVAEKAEKAERAERGKQQFSLLRLLRSLRPLRLFQQEYSWLF
jgi:acyl-CoA reductase-like NAD-dependent aldehyde dehydrogenase